MLFPSLKTRAVEFHTDSNYLEKRHHQVAACLKQNGWRTKAKQPVKMATCGGCEAATLPHKITGPGSTATPGTKATNAATNLPQRKSRKSSSPIRLSSSLSWLSKSEPKRRLAGYRKRLSAFRPSPFSTSYSSERIFARTFFLPPPVLSRSTPLSFTGWIQNFPLAVEMRFPQE